MEFSKIGKFAFDYICTEWFKIRIKPKTIQLPITNRCNSRCVTCNIWKEKEKKDIDFKELKRVLSDEYFSKVKSVGINGGEPFLHENFIKLIDVIVTLPSLKSIYIISNGLSKCNILEKLALTKDICNKNNVLVNLCVSIDGINDTQSKVRGVENSFEKTYATYCEIEKNKNKYCDKLTIGTTISESNIFFLPEIQAMFENATVQYHLAVPNERLFTRNEFPYYIFNSEYKTMLAKEWFYGIYKSGKSFQEKISGFMNFYQIENLGNRISKCSYLLQDITITENLDMCLCATAGHVIGNLKNETPQQILSSYRAKREVERVCAECSMCMHYVTFPTFKAMLLYLRQRIRPAVYILYMILAKFYK